MVLSRQPDMAHRLRSPEFEETLRRQLTHHRFDVVQLEGLELGPLLRLARALSPQSRIVYDAHNAEAALQWRTFRADLARPSRWPAAL
jgi:hypothetical protein